MATETLQVSAVSSPDQWSLIAGANKVAAVNQPDNDGTSFIRASADDLTQQYALSNTSTVGAGDTINSVTIWARLDDIDGGDPYRFGAVLGGSTSDTGDLFDLSSHTWTTKSLTLNTKPGGGAWTKADVDALEVFVTFGSSGGSTGLQCTTLYAVVDYT